MKILKKNIDSEKSNFKKKTWEEKITYYEEKLLKKKGIKNYQISSIIIKEVKMSYIEIGDKKNPKLLLIHGLLSSGIYFFKILPYLKKYFFIIIIDCIGFGKSDRPLNEKTKDKKKALNFFLDPILIFIDKLNLDNFFLLGHSFGGFLSGHLIPHIEDKIKAVFLVSPCGFVFKSLSEIEKEKFIQKCSLNHDLPEFIVGGFFNFFKGNVNLSNYLPEFIKNKIIKHSLENKRIFLDEEEKEIFFNLYNLYFKKKPTYLNNFFEIIQFNGNSYLPINEILEKYKHIDCFVYYPENDFLNYENVQKEMLRINKKKNFKILNDTNHQIFIHKIDEFLEFFLIDILKFL